MPRKQKKVSDQIMNLLHDIESWDGSSGHPEIEYRNDLQSLLRLLSEHPFDLYQLPEEVKEKIRKAVESYLTTSFGNGDGSWWG